MADAAPLPFAASFPPPAQDSASRYRTGWALALMVTAETLVAILAMLTESYAIGIVATSTMAIAGLVLVAAESYRITQEHRR